MALNTKLAKPDVGGTMSTKARVFFIVFLTFFVGLSVYMSFNMLSRPTYEFTYSEADGGWVFDGFNGNASTEELRIEHPMEKVDGKWVEAEGTVVKVDSYTLVSDEYVKYIYIGKDVREIADQAFVYCKQLRAFYVDEENPNYCSVNGVLYTKDMTEIISYPICHCTQVVIDDIKATGKVENIGIENVETFTVDGKYVKGDEGASTIFTAVKDYIKANYSGDFDYFNEFSEISLMMDEKIYAPYLGTYYHITEQTDSSITVERFWTCDERYTVPDTVKKVWTKAFYKCDRLVEITLPDSITYIGDMVFFNCWRLSTIDLPDALEEMGDDAFSYCSGIKYAVYIPASVKTIGHHCFYKCNEDLDFYMGAQSEDDIDLGGRWQPRNDNKFKAKPAIWGQSEEDYHAYVDPLFQADEEAARKAAEEAANGNASTESAEEGENDYAIIIMALLFIPAFLYVGLQVIRNIFKDDFLMTKKGKARLAKQKAEREMIHQSYIQEQAEAEPEAETETETEGGEN